MNPRVLNAVPLRALGPFHGRHYRTVEVHPLSALSSASEWGARPDGVTCHVARNATNGATSRSPASVSSSNDSRSAVVRPLDRQNQLAARASYRILAGETHAALGALKRRSTRWLHMSRAMKRRGSEHDIERPRSCASPCTRRCRHSVQQDTLQRIDYYPPWRNLPILLGMPPVLLRLLARQHFPYRKPGLANNAAADTLTAQNSRDARIVAVAVTVSAIGMLVLFGL